MRNAPREDVDVDTHVARAIEVAVDNVARGGGPFGAVILGPEGEVAWGCNRVTSTLDPTAHAEIVAIRAACHELGDFSLAGHVLYSSCEPCPMCLAACLWARLDRVVFAADRQAAHRAGFDDSLFHDLFRADPAAHWSLEVVHRPHPRSEAPFDAWRAREGRVDY